MTLQSLILKDFRNYSSRTFQFVGNVTLLVGPNGSGKTNVVEAIFLLATGESFRALRVEEMIRYEQELARISGIIGGDTEDRGMTLEMVLTRGELSGKRVAKRHFRIDGAAKRVGDFVGKLVVVLFRPEDLQIVLGSPQVRRKFLNQALIQIDPHYRRSLASYEKALSRRNRILDAIREGSASRTQLVFWDGLLIKHGQLLTSRRQAFLDFINRSRMAVNSFQVGYDASVVSEKRLAMYAEQEIAVGYTLVGPHKDDLLLTFNNGKPLVSYGSRGAQRLAVLWLKLAELAFVAETIGARPLLLLDDILSELDREHRALVLRVLPQQQTILTTTDLHLVGSTKGMEIVELR